jgi:glutamyl-Q tRNA(Asp) synthetase
MHNPSQTKPKLRFAPSPNGYLHLGHAYSALLNQQIAIKIGGDFLLRIEDIDLERCTPELEAQMLDDLNWLGIEWQETPMRQSEQFERYQSALDVLLAEGLIYPATLSRGAVKREVQRFEESGQIWPRDPDGTPHYPKHERDLSHAEIDSILRSDEPYSLRLNMSRAMKHVGASTVSWNENGEKIIADPSQWGDVILARKDTPASYHLCVVLDDAMQNIAYVVRGRDLYQATAVHRLLQELLNLPEPSYNHHELLLDTEGKKLSKSENRPQILHNEYDHFGANSSSLYDLRQSGAKPEDIKRILGF